MTSEFEPSQGKPIPGNSGDTTGIAPTTRQASDLKGKVAEDLHAARNAIKEGADTATGKVKETITEQKDFAAHQVGGIATALEKVGAELEQSDQPHVGRYAREIGGSMQGFAKTLEGKDLAQVATMAEDFGRKQPLAFLGVAALAGLAASRFLTASSQRVESTRSTTPSSSYSAATSSSGHGGSDNG